MMKTFKAIAAQGEITIIRVGNIRKGAKLPPKCTPLVIEHGRYIVGHSETGHHHVMDARGVGAVGVLDGVPAGMRILHMIVNSPTPLIHLREYDTHDPIMLEPGEYRVNIGREYDPYQNLSRMQAD